MSAQIITARDLSDECKLTVSFRLLLGLYSIIPLCLMLQMVDGWFWHGFLRENLPTRPRISYCFKSCSGRHIYLPVPFCW